MPDSARTTIAIVPLLGALHLRMPQYNAVSVLRTVQQFRPGQVALAPLTPGALDDPGWQDTPEVVLPHTVVPWARRAGVPLIEVGVEAPDASAQRDFRQYLSSFEGGRSLLSELDAAERPVWELLERPLTLESVEASLLPAIRSFQERREALLGDDGPGTGWQRQRAQRIADAVVASASERVALLAGADDVPLLRDALADRVRLVSAPRPEPDRAVRERGLLDVSMRGDAADPSSLLDQLRAIDGPEARYLEANLLLQAGDAETALEVLEAASRQDFVEPYYLPGFLLTRLGQLYDLAGRRDAALRAYRGARALAYAPPEALAAAEAGLREPFALRAAVASPGA